MKHRSAPKEKGPQCLPLWGPLGDTPTLREQPILVPYKAPKGTNTEVTSAKGHFCAYPNNYPSPSNECHTASSCTGRGP